jgi:hypothetical protein
LSPELAITSTLISEFTLKLPSYLSLTRISPDGFNKEMIYELKDVQKRDAESSQL